MARFYYDLHLHSCLSPCADNDNTPYNLVGMGKLSGLQILALTDHNTCRNCPAFFAAAAEYGVVPVAGMELTTAEDIHMVCLFSTLSDALDFDRAVDARRVRVKNRVDIFGEQWVCNDKDEPVEQEPDLLSNATTLSLEEGAALTAQHHGVYYPAHIDREANGILATLGMLPPTPPFAAVELHDPDKVAEYREKYDLAGKTVVVSSDAHYLFSMRDAQSYFELDAPADDPQAVRDALLRRLQNGEG